MDGSSWRLVIRLGISHGTHEALTFLAARVAGDGGDARKALQVGPKIGWNRESEGFLGRVGSVFWYVYCICVLFYFIYDMIYDIYIYICIFLCIFIIYIYIDLLIADIYYPRTVCYPELFVITIWLRKWSRKKTLISFYCFKMGDKVWPNLSKKFGCNKTKYLICQMADSESLPTNYARGWTWNLS